PPRPPRQEAAGPPGRQVAPARPAPRPSLPPEELQAHWRAWLHLRRIGSAAKVPIGGRQCQRKPAAAWESGRRRALRRLCRRGAPRRGWQAVGRRLRRAWVPAWGRSLQHPIRAAPRQAMRWGQLPVEAGTLGPEAENLRQALGLVLVEHRDLE